MRIILLFVLYLSHSCYSRVSYREFPEECYSAEALDDESRQFENFDSPTSQANDLDLKKGWYRVLGKAGNSLKQGYDRPLRTGKDSVQIFCGTKQPGTLMGEHPTVEEGLVEMTVCFRESECFYDKVKECACSSNQTVFVRNCLRHYIYWLSPTGAYQRYCTGKTTLVGPKVTDGKSEAIECKQHKIIESPTRIWSKRADVTCDADYKGWYRFSKYSGYEIASTCAVNNITISRFSQPCGATFRGWMLDRHPSMKEGRVQRRVCFSYAEKCTCEFFSNIYVRNCGDFYVYRLNGVPACNSRYCGANVNQLAEVNDASKPPVNDLKDLCKANYNVMHDPDRLWSFTSPTVSKCDAGFYGIFRFGSKYTPWSIHEGCNKSDLSIVTHRCGSHYQGYMEDVHPLEKDGVVDRVICFSIPKFPCECQYTSTIKVQNCGDHFVYQFKGVPICSARYCMVANKSSAITLDPGRFPLYEIPSPGYKPAVAKQVQKEEDNDHDLIEATTTLAVLIFIIVLIILIVAILLVIFVLWPTYKKRRRSPTISDLSLTYAVPAEPSSDTKPSTSNGDIRRDQKDGDPSAPFPTEPPSEEPPRIPETDSIPDMKKGPGSDDDLNTIPEDTEHDNTDTDEYDTLLKKEDLKKPDSYEKSTKDTMV